MSALLVTGTDTGVGKTLVTATLAVALRARGLGVDVAKPVETGCATIDGDLYPEDAATLASAAESTAPLCPYRFPDPLAPMLAAARSGATIDVADLVRGLAARAARVELLLIEGAGGLLVPLTPHATWADVAQALDAPVLLVVGSRLGAVNHALLTLEALARRRLRTVGYVVSRIGPDDDLAVATNAALLRELTTAPCLGEIPRLPDAAAVLADLRTGGGAAIRARTRLADIARSYLSLDALATAGTPTR